MFIVVIITDILYCHQFQSDLVLMAKRNAATELNHDNWEEEDEKEEAGEFKKASDEQMKVDILS